MLPVKTLVTVPGDMSLATQRLPLASKARASGVLSPPMDQAGVRLPGKNLLTVSLPWLST